MVTRTVLLGAACAAGMVLILAAIAVPVVADAQEARNFGRTPVDGPAASVSLRMLSIGDAVAQRPLRRVAVANAAAGPMPPGVEALPNPGEMVVTPALHALIAADPTAARRFPQKEIGLVGPEGLTAPDELYAYVGVTEAEMPGEARAVVGYHRPQDGGWRQAHGTSEIERFLTPPRVVAVSFAFFLGFPLAFLLAMCVRFDATRRDRRLAALRLIGASARQAHLSAAAEMGFISVVGVVVGWLAFRIIAPLTGRWSFGRFHWYADDVHVSGVRIGVLAVLVVGLSILVSALGSRSATKAPMRVRRSGGSGRPSYWRLVPVAVGPIALLIAPTSWLAPRFRLLALAVGITGSVLALAMMTPLLLAGVGAVATRVRRLPPWGLLAARRAEHSPTIAPKLVTGVLVAMFVAGFGMMIGANVRAGLDIAGNRSNTRPAMAQAFGVPRAALDRMQPARAVDHAILFRREVAFGEAGESVPVIVVWASCETVRGLFGHVGDCQDGTSYRTDYGSGGERQPADIGSGDAVAVLAPDRTMREQVTVPSARLPVSGDDLFCQCDVIVTETPTKGDLVLTSTADRDGFWADIARYLPGISFQGDLDRNQGFDADAILTLLSVGLMLTVSLGFIGFTIASVDRAVEARHRDAPLLAIGVPARVLRLADAVQLIIVIAFGAVLGIMLLIVAVRAWAHVFNLPQSSLLQLVGPQIGAVVAGLLLLALTITILTTRNRSLAPEELRRE